MLEHLREIAVKQNSMAEAILNVSSQQQLLFEELDFIKIKLQEGNRTQPTTGVIAVETPFDLIPLKTIEEIDDFDAALAVEAVKNQYVSILL